MGPIPLPPQSQKAWDARVSAMKRTARFEEHNNVIHHPDVAFEYRQLQLPEGSPGFTEGLATLKYTFDIVGPLAPGAGLYPLFIILHGGGGGTDSGPTNDSAWNTMRTYYKGAVKTSPGVGIYLALRGIGNSWDMHFTSAGYELIQKLIENMIMFERADPDRVYPIGFSAGGDGVYSLTAHLSNRFAAGNMSAGSPSCDLTNIINVPLCLQVGEQDTGTNEEGKRSWRGFNRSLTAADKDLELTEWSKRFQGLVSRVYIHETFLHPTRVEWAQDQDQKALAYTEALYYDRHNSWESSGRLETVPRPLSNVVADIAKWRKAYKIAAEMPDLSGNKELTVKEANTNAVDWVTTYTRNPLPQCIAWDLKTRPNPPDAAIDLSTRSQDPALVRKGQYYWLDIGARTNKDLGIDTIQARIDGNTITIDAAKTYLRILLRGGEPGLPDLRRLITIVLPKVAASAKPQTITLAAQAAENTAVIEQTLALNDPRFIFTSDIVLNQDASSGQWTARRTPHPTVSARL